jgi:hypothetical protein
MTDEQVNDFYEKLKSFFGENLPDLDHEPIRFAYYVKLYTYCNGKE